MNQLTWTEFLNNENMGEIRHKINLAISELITENNSQMTEITDLKTTLTAGLPVDGVMTLNSLKPAVVLEYNAGGSGAINVEDKVSGILRGKYTKDGIYKYAASGLINSSLLLKDDGSVENPEAPQTPTTAKTLITSEMLDLKNINNIEKEYLDLSATSIFNQIGTDLGNAKDGDTINSYSVLASAATQLETGTSANNSASSFYIYKNANGTSIKSIKVILATRKIEIEFATGYNHISTNYMLKLDSATVALEKIYENDAGIGFTYNATDDSILGSVVAGTTTFELTAIMITGFYASYDVINGKMISKNTFNPVYYYVETINKVITDEAAYTNISTLSLPGALAGTYQLSFKANFNYDSATTKSAMFRISLDNGVIWEYFKIKPEDALDTKLYSTIEILNQVSDGNVNILFEGKTEDAADTLTVNKNTIILERKI